MSDGKKPPVLAPAGGKSNKAIEKSIVFERHVLSTQFFCEGATFADIDRDGKNDVISGPFWYRGPDFAEKHELYEPKSFDPAGYSDNFFAFAHDFDGDGWLDVFVIGFPGQEAAWLENPRGADKHWTRHLAFAEVDNEAPTFTNLTGDGKPELVFHTKGRLGWAEWDRKNPGALWTFHPLSSDVGYGKFTHGLGVADVNGDGRMDVLERTGWWEQPQSLVGDPVWNKHEFLFTERMGGAQMYAYDVDGDGDNDVITSLAAHGYGLAWFEQVKKDGAIDFVEHRFMDDEPDDSEQGVCFAELHALDLVDMNGDGLKDIVTGKRIWSHGTKGDPQPGSPAVSYWFQLVRGPRGVSYVPHLIDDDSGVGVQVVAGDIDDDKKPDVVVGNKKGTFVLLQRNAEAEKPVATRVTNLVGYEHPEVALNLNLGFERGDLSGWTATGDAFDGQPIHGDTVTARGREASHHDGAYWIGGYEKKGDAPKGTLTSDPFEVGAPFASFLASGGGGPGERIELWDAGAKEPFFTTTAANFETLQRVVVDLTKHVGQKIFVRLVDDESGGWGHINFDSFRFYAWKPLFPIDSAVPLILPADPVLHRGLAPKNAARAMTVPKGFHVDLIASEPEIQQPIAFTFDPKGRIWLAEAFSYPVRQPEGQGRDTILVLEDRDHDGSFETRTVFADNLNLVSGLEVGFGGVWVGAAPYLMFIPDKNDDLVPDGPPEILLDGWGYQDTHETLNAFTWGPDGWLYGCHGVFTHSRVGKPGTPDSERTPINAGVWRFHPTRREFEVFAWGTSNPWGIDFDDRGQAFITACVIPHLFHVIQGARYERQAGEHFGAYVFDDIKTIADHSHYLGKDPWAANLRSGSAGGGHAHCGAMIYLGGQFPEKYRNTLFMSNIHGNRINNDVLERSGSGFVGHHGQDFLLANDAWFRGINLKYGPDGSVYLIDWYDKQACHLTTPESWDRTNGRLYRVTNGKYKPVAVDLRKLSSSELVKLQSNENDWYVRKARLVLAERGPDAKLAADLRALSTTAREERVKLRALWSLAASGSLEEADLLSALRSKSEALQAWAIQLACESRSPSKAIVEHMEEMASRSSSSVVRTYIASALQRMPPAQGFAIARSLALHGEDASDHNQPLMDWYAIEPLVAADPSWGIETARATKIPLLETFIARRLAADETTRDTLVQEIAREHDGARRIRLLETLRAAVAELRDTPMPSAWPPLYAGLAKSNDAVLRDAALEIAAAFGDKQAFPALRTILADAKADAKRRERALGALLRGKNSESVTVMQHLLDEKPLRSAVIKALASFDDSKTPHEILARYASFDEKEKSDALNALSARPSFARELLASVEKGTVKRTDVSPFVLRKLENLGDEEIKKRVASTFGVVHPSKPEKDAKIAALEGQLTDAALAKADRAHGRALFAKTCSQCHTLFDAGGTLAPNLTGSNRKDFDYLLTNIVDPNAVITKEYQVTMVWLKDEQLVTGITKAETDDTLTLQAENATNVVDKCEIADRKLSDLSTMPEGLLDALEDDEIRDLVAYVRGDEQIAPPADKESAARFFDGKTLAGWSGDMKLWSVEKGEIVGRTSGLAQNEFLKSSLELNDFRLIVDVLLVKNEGNSGIQLRSKPLANGEMQGYQADVGPGWWGKLYEENGRGLVWDKPGDGAVKSGEWNHYEIVAVGHHVMTALNGTPCVDLEDKEGALSGIIALQLHSGGATEVRFRNFKLELDPKPELVTVTKKP